MSKRKKLWFVSCSLITLVVLGLFLATRQAKSQCIPLPTYGGCVVSNNCTIIPANYGDWARCPAGFVATGHMFNMGSDPADWLTCCELQCN